MNFHLKYQIDADARKAKSELRDVDSMIDRIGTGIANNFSSITAAGTAAAAGIGLVVAAGIAATRQLFDLSRQAAEFGSEIFDASEKTGLHAETLSAMKFAADQSGSSLDEITGAIGKFSKTVGAAVDGSKEATAALTALGLDPKEAILDLDVALEEVFKRIVAAKPGIEQMTLAQKAFGRSGAELLPFIKSFDGDLKKLVKTAKELGVTIDDEAARAADEFGDSLDTLSTQVTALGRQIATPLIPRITELTKTLSNFLKENQEGMSRWQEHTSLVFDGVLGYWEDLRQAVASYNLEVGKAQGGPFPGGTGFGGPLGLTPQQRQPIGDAIDRALIQRGRQRQMMTSDLVAQQANIFRFPDAAEFAKERIKEAENRAREREAAFRKELAAQSRQNALLLAAEKDAFKQSNEAWEKAFLAGETEKDKFREAALNNIKAYGQKAQALLDQQRTRELQGTSGTERENVFLEHRNASAALYNDLQRERADLEKILGDQQKKLDDQAQKAADDRLKAREEELKLFEESMEAQSRAMVRANELESERLKLIREQAEERHRALGDQMREHLEQRIQGTSSGGFFDIMGGGFGGQLSDATGAITSMDDVMKQLGATATDVFMQMGQGLGTMLESWVLLGDQADVSVKKMTASILAGVASQAAMLAIFHTAMGIAALTPWGAAMYGPAPLHFKAAALWGAVAVGAALAGRAVAGDSFQGKGGGGNSAGSGASSAQRDLTPISRVSDDAFVSGRSNLGPAADRIFTHIAERLRGLDNTMKKFEAAKPGTVFMAGMKSNRGAIGKQMVEDVRTNASTGTALQRAMGSR